MKLLISIWLVLLPLFVSSGVCAEIEPEEVVEITPYVSLDRIPVGSDFKMALGVRLRKGWHINSDRPGYEFAVPTEVSLADLPGIEILRIDYPPPAATMAVPGGGMTALFSGDFLIKVHARAGDILPGPHRLQGKLLYQACDEKRCLRPTEVPFVMDLSVVSAGEAGRPLHPEVFTGVPAAVKGELSGFLKTGDISSALSDKGMLVTILLLFVGGLALNLTPCVYPIIPITIGYFSSQKGGGGTAPRALAYMFGMSFMYSSLGVIAALSGRMFGSVLTHPAVLVGISMLMAALSLSLFGLYEFRLPTGLMNLGGARGGVAGAFLMGLTMGIVAAPCIGPFIVGLLAWVAASGNPVLGFVVFFTLSLGLGLPYLVLGLFSGSLSSLPRSGEWMVGVRKMFGIILLLMALYFLEALIPPEVFRFLFPVALGVSGTVMILVIPSGRDNVLFHVLKTAVAVALISAGVWIGKPAPESGFELSWQVYSEASVAEASVSRKPVVIDFFADWCVPCKELDTITFRDPSLKTFTDSFVFLKADLSIESDEVARIREAYDIRGVPTVVFLRADGTENQTARLTGFAGPEEFVRRLEATRGP